MGNRGRLHEGRGRKDIVRTHQGMAWITCVYRSAWADTHAGSLPYARDMDERLNSERRPTPSGRLHDLAWNDMPDGVFVLVDQRPGGRRRRARHDLGRARVRLRDAVAPAALGHRDCRHAGVQRRGAPRRLPGAIDAAAM